MSNIFQNGRNKGALDGAKSLKPKHKRGSRAKKEKTAKDDVKKNTVKGGDIKEDSFKEETVNVNNANSNHIKLEKATVDFETKMPDARHSIASDIDDAITGLSKVQLNDRIDTETKLKEIGSTKSKEDYLKTPENYSLNTKTNESLKYGRVESLKTKDDNPKTEQDASLKNQKQIKTETSESSKQEVQNPVFTVPKTSKFENTKFTQKKFQMPKNKWQSLSDYSWKNSTENSPLKPFKSTFSFGNYAGLGKHKKEESFAKDTPKVEESAGTKNTEEKDEMPEFIDQLANMTVKDSREESSSDNVMSLVNSEQFMTDDTDMLEEATPQVDTIKFPMHNNDTEFVEAVIKGDECILSSLTVPLYKHQVLGLNFLRGRERIAGLHKGGLLCDDMGLGKTLQTIALIAEHKMQFSIKNDICKTTLIVAPPVLIGQWAHEIKTKAKNLSVLKYHDNEKTWADGFDVVLTSIYTLSTELRKKGTDSPFYSNKFWRLIVDEAHVARNPFSQLSKAIDSVSAVNRWCLTGTPIHNSFNDMLTLLKLIKINDYSDLTENVPHMMGKTESRNTGPNSPVRNVMKILPNIMLRRTKNILKLDSRAFNLKKKNIHDIKLKFCPLERKLYDQFKDNSIKMILDESETADCIVDHSNVLFCVKEDVAIGANMALESGAYVVAFLLLLRLRQLCCNWQLIYTCKYENPNNALIEHTKKDKPQNGEDKPKKDKDIEELSTSMETMGIKYQCICCDNNVDPNEAVCVDCDSLSGMKQNSVLTTKLKGIAKILARSRDRKTVIFTSFVANFRFVEKMLKRMDIEYEVFRGDMSFTARNEALSAMHRAEKQVLICSLMCSNVGLNLVFATQAIIMDPWWNPQIELQAIDRVYRIGQAHDVDVHRLWIEDSVEQRILELQTKKLQLAKMVVDGEKPKGHKGVTLNDLYGLLDVERGTFD